MNEQYQASGQPQKTAAAKWLWITLIIVVLLGGAFAAWYYLMGPGKAVESSTAATTTTTPVDETADWKTYTNSDYGFSLKYPSDWAVSDKSSGYTHDKDIVAAFGAAPASATNADLAGIIIYSKNLSETITKIQNIESANTNSQITSNTDITKFGTNGKKITIQNKTNSITGSTYYVEKDNRTFAIPIDNSQTDANIVKSLKIYNTFQFTSAAAASATTSTADWKTYTNTKLGISLKYPKTYSQAVEQELGSQVSAAITGTEIWVDFSKDPRVVGCSPSSDFSASRGESACEKIKTFTFEDGKCNNISCTEVKTAAGESTYFGNTSSGEGGAKVLIGFVPLKNSIYKAFAIEIDSSATGAEQTLKDILKSVQYK